MGVSSGNVAFQILSLFLKPPHLLLLRQAPVPRRAIGEWEAYGRGSKGKSFLFPFCSLGIQHPLHTQLAKMCAFWVQAVSVGRQVRTGLLDTYQGSRKTYWGLKCSGYDTSSGGCFHVKYWGDVSETQWAKS